MENTESLVFKYTATFENQIFDRKTMLFCKNDKSSKKIRFFPLVIIGEAWLDVHITLTDKLLSTLNQIKITSPLIAATMFDFILIEFRFKT